MVPRVCAHSSCLNYSEKPGKRSGFMGCLKNFLDNFALAFILNTVLMYFYHSPLCSFPHYVFTLKTQNLGLFSDLGIRITSLFSVFSGRPF